MIYNQNLHNENRATLALRNINVLSVKEKTVSIECFVSVPLNESTGSHSHTQVLHMTVRATMTLL